jgi:hypothetical protein
VQIAAGEAEAADPALIEESERESLPLQGPEIAATRALFTPAGKESRDIMKTIQSCIKEARKCKTRRAVKMITQLVAMSEYINLRARYKKHKGCKRPNLNASITIASRMGKGAYFAHQIRHHALYLKQHKHLPPPKSYTQGGYRTLLDNEGVLHDVRVYLAAQSLGTVSPRVLCHHVNDIILPALRIDGKIVESTAQCWLKFRLGYECKEAHKGMYVDGHERLDVIKERDVFINEQLNKYER